MKKLLAFFKSRRVLVILLIVSAAIVGLWFYYIRSDPANGAISASGTVETVEVQIGPQLSGRVTEVMVAEGDQVKTGDVLFRLDDAMLQSQRQQAEASLQVANDNLAAAKSGVTSAEAALKTAQDAAEAARTQSEAQLITARQNLQDLYDNADVARAAAEQALAVATKAFRDAQYQLDNFTVPSDQENMTTLEALDVTLTKLNQARADFKPYEYYSSGNETRKDLKEKLDNAQSAYDSAVRRFELETTVNQAKARQAKAMQDYEELQNGPKQENVDALEAQIAALEAAPRQAASAVAQAQVGVTQAQDKPKQATSAVMQAQAALDAIKIQIQYTVVSTLTPGVVLDRAIEPGEVVAAGAPVMTIGQLDPLQITVYVPESRYGMIKLGQEAQVSVDSFPGQTFTGMVSYIANQAEFTPRNVQTVSGRETTVYAVKLTIANPDQKLKPGMPADVMFE
jgi:HlyD family secretion protein